MPELAPEEKCFAPITLLERQLGKSEILTISEILGHSKLTTSLIYSHTDKERKQKAVESLLKL